ncbi:hypothetical protein A6V37_29820 [Paraburkholderia ginsengiterrae]|nr:hypothetical protein A6V37_29820 [Paraburkholderia ginsengiterrae]
MNALAAMWRVCVGFLTCILLLILAGCDAVVDSVNSLHVTRTAWRNVALEAGARLLEIESSARYFSAGSSRKPSVL